MAVQQTECYRVVTIGYLKNFIGTLIQDSSNGSVKYVNLNALSAEKRRDDYCPTYSELTSNSLVQTWKPGDTPNGDRDGITVNPTAILGGSYAANQLVDQRDLSMTYTRFSGLTVSTGKTNLSACGDSTSVSYSHKYLRYTKSMNDSCTTGTSSAEVSDTTCSELTWHPSLGAVSSCNTYTIEKNSSSTGEADARPITLYAHVVFRGSNRNSNTVNMTQSALGGRWVDYSTVYEINTTTDGEAYDTCSAQNFSVGGTGVTRINYYWEDYCGASYPSRTTATTSTTTLVSSGGSFSAWDCCNGPHTASSSFTFNYGTKSKTVTFTQNCADCSSSCGAPQCRVSSNKYLLPSDGGTIEVKLKDNDTDEVLSATWSASPSDGVTINGGNITFPRNTTTTDKEYTVVGTNGSCSASKLITVAGTSGPSPCSLVVTDSTYLKSSSSAKHGNDECDSAYMYKGNVSVIYNPASASTWLTYKITWQGDSDWSTYACSDYQAHPNVAYSMQDKLGLTHDKDDPNLCSIAYIMTENTGNDRDCVVTYAINGQECNHQVRIVQEGRSGPPPTPTGCSCSEANFSVTGKSVNAGTNVVVGNYTANCTDGATVGFRSGDNFLEGGIWLSNGSIIAGKVNSHTEDLSGIYGIYVNGDRCATFTVTSPGGVTSCADGIGATAYSITCDEITTSVDNIINFDMSGWKSGCNYAMQVEVTDNNRTQVIPFDFNGNGFYSVVVPIGLEGSTAQVTIGGIAGGEIWSKDCGRITISQCIYEIRVINNASVTLENIVCHATFNDGTTATFPPVNSLTMGSSQLTELPFVTYSMITNISVTTTSPYSGTLKESCYIINSTYLPLRIEVIINCATIK